MGRAFLGRSATGTPVMVRIIHQHLAADPGFRARLAREAGAARRADGAFIAPLLDVDADAPLPWLVSAYVDGPSLATVVPTRGPLPVRMVLTLATGLAEALNAAHAAGVVHGDLNPARVLLTAEGPRLIDFGIGRAAGRGLPGIGMPDFMAPEQAAGRDAGPASDMFSLGTVLLYATTGAWMSHFIWHPDQLPAEVRPLIERCLAADPARRPTASQLRSELTGGHPAPASPATWPPAETPPASPASYGVWPAQDAAPPASAAPYGVWPAQDAAPAPASTATYGAWPSQDAAPPSSAAPYGVWPAQDAAPAPPGTQAPGPYGAWPTQGGTPAPPLPAQAIRPRARKVNRRLVQVIATAGLALAVAIAGAVYVIHPWPYPVLRPAGLTAGQRGPSSISLSWSPPVSGPLPDKYVILQDGITAGTVPGNVDHFKKDGLAPATAYDYQVVAYRGSTRSQPSPDLRAVTRTPPLSEAVFNSDFSVTEKLEAGGSGVTGDKNGDTWTDNWTFSGTCDLGPCVTHLSGAIDGEAFTVVLKGNGYGSYSGTVPINDYYYCGNSQSDYVDSSLLVVVTAKAASASGTQWQASKLTGDVTWDIGSSPSDACGGTLSIGVTG